MKRGWGADQLKKMNTSQSEILKVLMDKKQHRYNELLDKTGLSTATLSKHLKKLEQQGQIEKEVDVKSGKYPYPAFYRLRLKGIHFQTIKQELKDFIDDIDLPDLLKALYLFIFLYIMEAQDALDKKKELSHYELMQRAMKQLMKAEEARKMITDSLADIKPRKT